jgi:hypothetical protein
LIAIGAVAILVTVTMSVRQAIERAHIVMSAIPPVAEIIAVRERLAALEQERQSLERRLRELEQAPLDA